MGAPHHHRLYRHGDTVVHRLPPHCKVLALLGFVLVVVSTPREAFWAFGVYGLLLAGVAASARVPPLFVARRMLIEVPFVLFAFALPVVATGEQVDVAGVSLSVDGLYGAWNILAKGTLGVVASILLAATTDLRDVLAGLQRLRLPSLVVEIMTFMLRYADVVTDQMSRMRVARESRGFAARDVRAAPVLARSAGALFIRAYERGERVHTAMLSRGYAGHMPVTDDAAVTAGQWGVAAVLPLAALAVAVAVRVVP